jgi:hypothetical protein
MVTVNEVQGQAIIIRNTNEYIFAYPGLTFPVLAGQSYHFHTSRMSRLVMTLYGKDCVLESSQEMFLSHLSHEQHPSTHPTAETLRLVVGRIWAHIPLEKPFVVEGGSRS